MSSRLSVLADGTSHSTMVMRCFPRKDCRLLRRLGQRPLAAQLGDARLGVDVAPVGEGSVGHLARIPVTLGERHALAAEVHGMDAALVEQDRYVVDGRAVDGDEVGGAAGLE